MLLDGRFYRQVLGLMVKLKLPPPFDNDNPNDCPEDFFSLKAKRSHQELSEDDDDSEIETTFESSDTRHHMTNSMVNKRIKLSTGLVGEKAKNYVSKPKTVPNEKRAATTTIEELFECNTLSIPKKQHHEINLKHLDIDTPVLQPELQTSESFGQIHPIVEEGKKEPKTDDNKQSILAQIKDADLVSDAELEQNRISESQQNEWPAFKNYQPGNPSQRLYIKNLHAKVTQLDLYRLFLKFIVLPDHLDSFDIVHMTKGRLRGQAFVTFPSIEIAERALQSTNGYMLQSRPMVVVSTQPNYFFILIVCTFLLLSRRCLVAMQIKFCIFINIHTLNEHYTTTTSLFDNEFGIGKQLLLAQVTIVAKVVTPAGKIMWPAILEIRQAHTQVRQCQVLRLLVRDAFLRM